MNYKLTLQYDGTEFHGWQIQGDLRTVQGELTRALSLIEGRDVVVHGSGRTDSGVHAEAQVASVMLERPITGDKLRAAINGNVGKDLRVISARPVSDDFHARYSARGKTYIYRILNAPVASPFWSRYAHHDARLFNLEKMKRAGELFLGKHDWTAFSAAQSDVEDRVRTIRFVRILERDDERARARMIEITLNADGFLRYMVRSIVGALLAVGRGELGHKEIIEAIEHARRPPAVVTAPACGLTLLNVDYE